MRVLKAHYGNRHHRHQRRHLTETTVTETKAKSSNQPSTEEEMDFQTLLHALNITFTSFEQDSLEKSLKAIFTSKLHLPIYSQKTTAATDGGSGLTVSSRLNRVMLTIYAITSKYVESIYIKKMPAVPSAYHLSEASVKPTCYTDYEPRMSHSITSLILRDDSAANSHHHHHANDNNSSSMSNNWTKELSFFDVKGVEKAMKKNYGYLDRKYIYLSHGNQSELALHLIVENGNTPLWLCELQKGFGKYPATMTDLDQGADISLELHYLNSKQFYTPSPVETNANKNVNGARRVMELSEYFFPFFTSVLTTNRSSYSYSLCLRLWFCGVELELLSDQCYRTTSLIPGGTHLLKIRQNSNKQVYFLLFDHVTPHSLTPPHLCYCRSHWPMS